MVEGRVIRIRLEITGGDNGPPGSEDSDSAAPGSAEKDSDN